MAEMAVSAAKRVAYGVFLHSLRRFLSRDFDMSAARWGCY